MKKLLTLSLIIVILFSFSVMAEDVERIDLTKEGNTLNTEPLQSNINKNQFSGTVTKLKFDLKLDYLDDESGVILRNVLNISAKQTLASEFRAGVELRIIKPLSNQEIPVELMFENAQFEYVGQFFRFIIGRTDLTNTISVMNYFGPYVTAGQRRLDLIGFTLPIYLKAGVPEISEIDLPPIAVSFYYFPTMLSYDYTTYFDRLEEFYMGQIVLNTMIMDNPFMFIANIGKGTTRYFKYSILSGNLSMDYGVNIDLFEHVKINASFGTMNIEEFMNTSAVSFGIEAHDFGAIAYVIDSLILEAQIPLGEVTGEFEPEQFSWFLMASNNIGNFRYFVGATTAGNDFTLKTVNPTDSKYTASFGGGNVYTAEDLEFRNVYGNYLSFYGGIGYEF